MNWTRLSDSRKEIAVVVLRMITFTSAGAVLIFRLLLEGPDAFFLLDALMIVFGAMCMAIDCGIEQENSRLKDAIRDFEQLSGGP